MPEISIIVPVYNVEEYLNKCIDSILNQSFKNFEIILVDDGSTDRSKIICDEYSKLDTRVTVIHKVNGGQSSARNIGLNIAKGNYIGFIDSDDYIHPNMYDILYENIIKYNADMAICNYEKVFDEKECFYKNDNNKEIKLLTNIEALGYLNGKYGSIYEIPCNKIIKREVLGNLRFLENRIHEDNFIAHHLLYKSKTIVYDNCKLYYYVQRIGSTMNSKFTLNRLDDVLAICDRIKFLRELKLIEIGREAEKTFIDMFFINYNMVKKSLKDIELDTGLKLLKYNFRHNLKFILKNPLFTLKQKIIFILFAINPQLYDMYKLRKDKLNYNLKGKEEAI